MTPNALYPRTLALREIIPMVCLAYDVSHIDIISERRGRALSHARQCLYYLARHHTMLSFPNIGKILNRDHTSVLTGAGVHFTRMKTDLNAARITRRLRGRIAEVAS